MALEEVMPHEPAESRPHVDSVLSKAHLLLTAFTPDRPTLGLTELSRRSGVSKGSVHRLASEMVDLGYLARTPTGYQLGWRIFELGKQVPGPAALRDVARPALQDLRTATRAVVHLSVPQGAECLYLDSIVGRGELAIKYSLSERVPNHATASGRVFLAHSGPEAIAALGAAALRALGVTSRAEIETKLAEIRRRRFAEDMPTYAPGIRGIAVPVMYPWTEHVIAAVSVSVSATRRDDQQLLSALWATAADISRGLGRGSTERPGAYRPHLVS